MEKDSDFSFPHNKSKSRTRTLLSDFGGGFLEFSKSSLVSEDSQENLDSLWNRIVRGELSVDSIIHGTVRRIVRGGMQVYIDGSCCVFLPGSLSNSTTGDFEEFVGNEYDFKIVKINNERKSIVVSRRGLPNSSFVSLPNVQEEEEPLDIQGKEEEPLTDGRDGEDDVPIPINSEITDTVSGMIYAQYKTNRDNPLEAVRDRLTKGLSSFLQTKKGSFVFEDGTGEVDILSAVEDILMPEGIVQAYYLSNCSNRKRDCPIQSCPLSLESEERTEKCPLSRNDCSAVILRPNCNRPRVEAMFPGNEILAIKALVRYCPEEQQGAVLAIMDFVWVPKCEKRPYEIEIEAQIVRRNTGAFDKRQDNILNSEIVSQLPPISLITKKNVESWLSYLDWRSQLIKVKKQGIRYLGWEPGTDKTTITFNVIAPSQEEFDKNRIWRRGDSVYAYPLSNSEDPWVFRDREFDVADRKKKDFGTELGDFVESTPVQGSPQIPDCPWQQPYVAKVTFALSDELRETVEKRLANIENEDVRDETDFLKQWLKIPAKGFLSLSYVGDESLIRRMKRTLNEFAKNGSNNSPFLSSFLFDIGQARLPVSRYEVSEFLNKELNDNQRETVETMLSAPDIALVQGPPGTGKTTVIAEAIYQFVRQGKKVLVSSQSIAAVDNALERLENIPEIRAVRLRKPSRYSKDSADASRYSEADVLQNFYDSLGLTVRDKISKRKRIEEDLKSIEQYIPELENLRDSIEREENALREASAAQAKLQTQLGQIDSEIDKNREVELQKSAVKALITLLTDSSVLPEYFEFANSIPLEIFRMFEANLLPVFEQYHQFGIEPFMALWDSGWNPDRKMDFILYLLREYRKIDDCLMLLSKDLTYLNNMKSEKIISAEASMRIQKLLQQEHECQAKMDKADDDGDDEQYATLEKEYRKIRRARKEEEKNARFSADQYKPFFTINDSRGIDIVNFMADSNRTKAEMVTLFKSLSDGLLGIKTATAETIINFTQKAQDFASGLKVTGDCERRRGKCRMELAQNKDKIRDGQMRLEERRKESDKKIAEIAQRFAITLSDMQNAISWCKTSRDALEERVQNSADEYEAVKPLWNEWLKTLETVSQVDQDMVLPTYLQSCSVVGITCTADDSILRDHGFDQFDVVIIDEVSKATPTELLLPLLKAEKVILVGDHRQLPPLFGEREPLTIREIMQREAEENVPEELRISETNFAKYKRLVEASLFKQHFEDADKQLKSSLWTQYRMHPDIMQIINEFYENKLKSGIENPDKERSHSLNLKKIPYFQNDGHAFWIDSTCDPLGEFFEEDQHDSGSKSNFLELQLILKTLQDLDRALEGQTFPPGKRDENGNMIGGMQIKKEVAVIAFYGKQKGLLRKEIRKLRFKNIWCKVETVDRFQGQERDYVLVSMTSNKRSRRKKKSANAFVAQFERINVAFSRARELLLIFGAKSMFWDYEINLPPLENRGTPRKSPVYRRILESLARKGRLINSNDIISEREWTQLKENHTTSRRSDKRQAFRGRK